MGSVLIGERNQFRYSILFVNMVTSINWVLIICDLLFMNDTISITIVMCKWKILLNYLLSVQKYGDICVDDASICVDDASICVDDASICVDDSSICVDLSEMCEHVDLSDDVCMTVDLIMN